MRLLPSVMKARSLAKRLIRSQARRAVYIPKSRQEQEEGPYTRLLGVEDSFEESAREEWAKHLPEWDLSIPEERGQLWRIIKSAAEDALVDARRSLEGDDAETARILDDFAMKFDPDALIFPTPSVEA